VNGQFFEQLGDDIDGRNTKDLFGTSVSLSSDGRRLAVGATDNDANGSNSGQVQIFEYVNNSWVQLGNDINGKALGDKSGTSVSLSSAGSVVAIGAYKNDGGGSDSGHVRLFEYNINDNNLWVQLGDDINGENASDESGVSVSLSDNGLTVAIGASQSDGNGSESGHVRIYKYDGNNWSQIGDDIDGEASGDRFGIDVSLSADGTILAVGANKNDGNGSSSGHVRIYNYDDTNGWVKIGNDIDGEAELDEAGISVDLSADGSVVAVGAHANDENGDRAGHVKMYQLDGGSDTWTQLGNDIEGENTFDESGYDVKLSSDGSTVVVGAYLNDGSGTDSGHVRFFRLNDGGTDWIQYGNDIDGDTSEDWSGVSVSLSADGETVAIGAYGNDGNGDESGHVRVVTMCDLPSDAPSNVPTTTMVPSKSPTKSPTKRPTTSPTKFPTRKPSRSPTGNPTPSPTRNPTKTPTTSPTKFPTNIPSKRPTGFPTPSPTKFPTTSPTVSKIPTQLPTRDPTRAPNSLYETIACVAVMDESFERTMEQVAGNWGKFRAEFPERPFCLLQPFYFIDGSDEDMFLEDYPDGLSEDMLRVPQSFRNDRRTSFHQVFRDRGNDEYADDWYELCDIKDLKERGIEKIALFVDQSGSMDIGTVQESYDLFVSNIQSNNIEIIAASYNDNEDWIKPFYSYFTTPTYEDDIGDVWCKKNIKNLLIKTLVQAPLRVWNALT